MASELAYRYETAPVVRDRHAGRIYGLGKLEPDQDERPVIFTRGVLLLRWPNGKYEYHPFGRNLSPYGP